MHPLPRAMEDGGLATHHHTPADAEAKLTGPAPLLSWVQLLGVAGRAQERPATRVSEWLAPAADRQLNAKITHQRQTSRRVLSSAPKTKNEGTWVFSQGVRSPTWSVTYTEGKARGPQQPENLREFSAVFCLFVCLYKVRNSRMKSEARERECPKAQRRDMAWHGLVARNSTTRNPSLATRPCWALSRKQNGRM